MLAPPGKAGTPVDSVSFETADPIGVAGPFVRAECFGDPASSVDSICSFAVFGLGSAVASLQKVSDACTEAATIRVPFNHHSVGSSVSL